MADIYAIFGTLLAVGISFPGMLTAWKLIFPEKVELARLRLQSTPWRTLCIGAAVMTISAFPTSILLALPFSLSKLLGVLLILIILGVASLGAAGLAAGMARRWRSTDHQAEQASHDFVKAAVALELAAAFPLIGWFLVIPLTIITALGAASYALLGWGPKTQPETAEDPTLIGAPAVTLDTPTS